VRSTTAASCCSAARATSRPRPSASLGWSPSPRRRRTRRCRSSEVICRPRRTSQSATLLSSAAGICADLRVAEELARWLPAWIIRGVYCSERPWPDPNLAASATNSGATCKGSLCWRVVQETRFRSRSHRWKEYQDVLSDERSGPTACWRARTEQRCRPLRDGAHGRPMLGRPAEHRRGVAQAVA
jgi:hypothetical protein